jgi:hypothetical protein
MFVRRKKNKSGVVSVQIIDKSSGGYKLYKTIGSSNNDAEIERLVLKANEFLSKTTGVQELDFSNSNQLIQSVLENISSHKLVGIDLVLYRLVYPKSKLKTTEYLYRFSQKDYSEDDIYRYMDKLQAKNYEFILGARIKNERKEIKDT